MNTSNEVTVTVDVCIYCDQPVTETFCCIWTYYEFHTKSDKFSTHDFKDLVKHSYKIKRTCKSKKRTSIKYDLDCYHLHTDGITLD